MAARTITVATILADIATLGADDVATLRQTLGIASRPAASSAASQHWTDRDIACNAPKPCTTVFRTEKGRDWHVANVKHA